MLVSNHVLKGEQDWGHGYILFFFTLKSKVHVRENLYSLVPILIKKTDGQNNKAKKKYPCQHEWQILSIETVLAVHTTKLVNFKSLMESR